MDIIYHARKTVCPNCDSESLIFKEEHFEDFFNQYEKFYCEFCGCFILFDHIRLGTREELEDDVLMVIR